MGYRLDFDRMDQILGELSKDYHIFGPKLDPSKKRVNYGEIKSVSQIVYDRQSDFSPKAAYYPITQVMFYFKEDRVEESQLRDEKGILIFARACDINAIRRSDNIFLKNGGTEDFFYKRLREKVKFVLMECPESFDNCFCVSMAGNVTEDYALAVRFETEGKLLAEIKDRDFAKLFAAEEQTDFQVAFIQENKKKAKLPQINRDNLKAVSDLDYWKKFDDLCIACGGCNTVCPTCTCFDTNDVLYTEGSNEGERRRTWSSCMLDDFTKTAGGNRARKTPGANMRFKVFHKFYDYKDRFGHENMCVGCGRCDIRCPKGISFFDAVCGLETAMESMNEGKEGQA